MHKSIVNTIITTVVATTMMTTVVMAVTLKELEIVSAISVGNQIETKLKPNNIFISYAEYYSDTLSTSIKDNPIIFAGKSILNVGTPSVLTKWKILKIIQSLPTDIARTLDHDENLILANKTHPLAPNYKPTDLTSPNVNFCVGTSAEEKQMCSKASKALERLFIDASKSGITLYSVSGYRSYEMQSQLFQERADALGIEYANNYVASPGKSEHQTGLAMDISDLLDISSNPHHDFGQTTAAMWLANNSYKFGFILRYPKGKEEITGYNFEPWHIRYVGIKAAREIKSNNLVLEEYLEQH